MVNLFELILSCLCGSIFGSFSTFIGYRLFNEKHTIFHSRSICCKCEKKILFRDLIPIFSFIFLHGKCRFCKTKIPMWHFYAEIFLTMVFVLFVFIFNGINIYSVLIWIIFWCLSTQSIIDYRTMMSSDIIHLIELVCCLLLSYKLGNSMYYIVAMFFCSMLFFVVITCLMKTILKKECLGFGDIKLFSILATLFDIDGYIVFIGLCGIFGILFYFLSKFFLSRNKTSMSENHTNEYFPFIPSMMIAFLLAFYFKTIKLI